MPVENSCFEHHHEVALESGRAPDVYLYSAGRLKHQSVLREKSPVPSAVPCPDLPSGPGNPHPNTLTQQTPQPCVRHSRLRCMSQLLMSLGSVFCCEELRIRLSIKMKKKKKTTPRLCCSCLPRVHSTCPVFSLEFRSRHPSIARSRGFTPSELVVEIVSRATCPCSFTAVGDVVKLLRLVATIRGVVAAPAYRAVPRFSRVSWRPTIISRQLASRPSHA